MERFSGLVLLIFVVTGLFGCATMASGPISEQETFPARNQDPRMILIVQRGTAHLNVYLYDQADRLVEQIYLAGNNRYLTVDGRNTAHYWARTLEVGRYKMEIFPFYYTYQVLPPARYRVDLQKRSTSFTIGRDPTNTYYGGRHWSRVVYLDGGDIPNTTPRGMPSGLPIKLDLQGKIWGLFGIGGE